MSNDHGKRAVFAHLAFEIYGTFERDDVLAAPTLGVLIQATQL